MKVTSSRADSPRRNSRADGGGRRLVVVAEQLPLGDDQQRVDRAAADEQADPVAGVARAATERLPVGQGGQRRLDLGQQLGARLGRSERHGRLRAGQPVGHGAGPGLVGGSAAERRARPLEQARQPVAAGQPRRHETAAQRFDGAPGDERPGLRPEQDSRRADEKPRGLRGDEAQPPPLALRRRRSPHPFGVGRDHEGGRAEQIGDPAQLDRPRRRQAAPLEGLGRRLIEVEPEQRRRQARQRATHRTGDVRVVDRRAGADRLRVDRLRRGEQLEQLGAEAVGLDEGGERIGGAGQREPARARRQPAEDDGRPRAPRIGEHQLDERGDERALPLGAGPEPRASQERIDRVDPPRGRPIACLREHAHPGLDQPRMRGQREAGRRRAARPRHGDGQAGDQIGLGVDRELHVGQVPRQIGDDVDVPLRPKMIDEAEARRNELRVGVRRAEVGVERAGLVVELVAPELRLAVENGGAVRAIGVEARQPPTGLGRLVVEAELLVGLQQQLQGRQTVGILIDDQLQVVPRAVPLARLGVDRAEPVAQIAEIGGRAGRQETQQLLEPQRRGGGVAARERQLGEHAARLDVARVQDRQLAVEAPPPRRCRRAAAPAPRAAARSARAEPPRRRPGTLRARCRARARGASPACGS